MPVVAVALAVASTLIGTYGAAVLGLEAGPLIIAVAASGFFVGLLTRRSR